MTVTVELRSDRPHQLSTRVGLRPESFGAMAYHFDNRRLVFLKTPELLALVRSLEEHDSIDAAIAAQVGDDPRRTNSYLRALESLAEAQVICER